MIDNYRLCNNKRIESLEQAELMLMNMYDVNTQYRQIHVHIYFVEPSLLLETVNE
jgi:hypothetical protein